MEDKPFSNREILAMFKEQKESFEELKTILVRIEKSTEKIETRVTDLEKRNEKKDGASDIIRYITISVATSVFAYLAWLGIQVFQITQTLSQYDEVIIQK